MAGSCVVVISSAEKHLQPLQPAAQEAPHMAQPQQEAVRDNSVVHQLHLLWSARAALAGIGSRLCTVLEDVTHRARVLLLLQTLCCQLTRLGAAGAAGAVLCGESGPGACPSRGRSSHTANHWVDGSPSAAGVAVPLVWALEKVLVSWLKAQEVAFAAGSISDWVGENSACNHPCQPDSLFCMDCSSGANVCSWWS